MGEMEKTGKIAPAAASISAVSDWASWFARAAPVPDISTPEAVKQALIKANTIAYTDPKLGGTSVEQLMKFAEGFGIKDEVVRKGVISTGGNDAAAKVAEGKADIAIVPITDIHAKEAKLVGPLPEAIQLWTSIPPPSRSAAPIRRRARLRRGA